MAKFAIPQSATLLREIPESKLDLRPDSEIIAELKTFRPVTSEKNVWAFWNNDLETMYPTHLKTVINWVRKLGPTWTVRVVDLVDSSPNNIYQFLGKEAFPDCFNNKTMKGRHAAQEASDLVRTPLLYKYGGMYMDVSNILHTHLDTLFWNALTAPDSPYEMGIWLICGQIRKQWGSFGNFMMAARKGCVFVKNWADSYKEVWKGHTSVDGFHKMPLLRDIGLADGMGDWDMGDSLITMSDYVAHMLIADRTRNLLDVRTGWNGREFYNTKSFMVEGIRNGILGGIKTNFDGYKQAELLLTRLDEPNEEKRREAEEFVVEMLEMSHIYKVYHNSAAGAPALGDLIKQEGFRDVFDRPGTFGELYRYGTVHWESMREVEQIQPQETDDKLIRATPTTPASAHR